jgi:hypothetical protein
MGTAPESWLRSGVINGKDEELARMLAYMAHATIRLIDMNQAANTKKHQAIGACMILAALGVLFFASAAWITSFTIA